MTLLFRYWKFIVMGGLGLLLALSMIRGNHYQGKAKACAEARVADRVAYRAAADNAEAKAILAKAATEAKYVAQAEEIDRENEVELAGARVATDRYIAAHRVRSATVERPRGGASPAPEDSPPGVPTDVSEGSVMVSDGDVRACSLAAAYATEAHNWAIRL